MMLSFRSIPSAHPGRKPGPSARRWPAWLCIIGVALGGLFGDEGASAQALQMRSGEHRGFTRLTIPIAPGNSWVLGRTADGYGVRLEAGSAAIDTSGVFARIARSRLADLRPAQDGVDLVLGCDCHAIAFQEAGLLVIDLRDGPPPAGARFETRLAGARELAPVGRVAFDWTRQVVRPSPEPADITVPGPDVPALALTSAISDGHARDLLARQFSRAVAQGLIRPETDWQRDMGPRTSAAETPAPSALDNLRIGAMTAIDRARGAEGSTVDREGAVCPSDALFDLAGWGGEGPLAAQIGAARRALLGEFDLPVPARVEALARLYLHAGFGAEARSLLDTLPLETPQAVTLHAIAGLIDEATPFGAQAAELGAHVGCDGAVALWAVLASPSLAQAGIVDRAAVRRAFADLPAHLRAHLGPALAQRFLDVSDLETAMALRNAIQPTAEPSAAVSVLDAGIELAKGRPDVASDIASAAAAGAGVGSAEAVIRMAEARIEGRLPLPADVVEDLITLAHEHRGTPMGTRLARLEAIALAEAGLYDAAFAVRDRLRAAQPSDGEAEAVSRQIVGRMVHGAPQQALLARLFTEDAWRDAGLGADDRRRLAERLLDAGFPQEALIALPELPADPAEALLAARAQMDLAAPAQALRVLAGHDGAGSDAMRGAALLAMGEPRAALAVFEAAGLDDEARGAAWQAGLWERAAADTPGPLADLLDRPQLAAAPVEAPVAPDPADATSQDIALPFGTTPEPGELSRANALLSEGAELRRLVAQLLEDYPPPQ
ncbi:MAG: hypothetical protein ACXIU8_03095 [Alkalilacustris sp.]